MTYLWISNVFKERKLVRYASYDVHSIFQPEVILFTSSTFTFFNRPTFSFHLVMASPAKLVKRDFGSFHASNVQELINLPDVSSVERMRVNVIINVEFTYIN